MHELGVVFHIADSVVKIAQDNQAQHVRRVTLQIGEVSTVIPDYLIVEMELQAQSHAGGLRAPVGAHPRHYLLRKLRENL